MRSRKIIITEPSAAASLSTTAESPVGPSCTFVAFAHGAGFDNDICGFVAAEVGRGFVLWVWLTPQTLDCVPDETLGTSATDKSFPLFSLRSDGVLVGMGAETAPTTFPVNGLGLYDAM